VAGWRAVGRQQSQASLEVIAQINAKAREVSGVLVRAQNVGLIRLLVTVEAAGLTFFYSAMLVERSLYIVNYYHSFSFLPTQSVRRETLTA